MIFANMCNLKLTCEENNSSNYLNYIQYTKHRNNHVATSITSIEEFWKRRNNEVTEVPTDRYML